MAVVEKDVRSPTAVLGHYIGGRHVDGGDRLLDVHNPSAGSVIRQLRCADAQTVSRAIASAREALPGWRATPAIQRARILERFRRLLQAHEQTIIELITAEHGKVLEDARGEFLRGLEIIEYACAAPELLKGEHSPNVGGGIDSWSVFHPVGVVAGITPFNFPVMVPMWMYPMALICGNTFILKPSEKDPSPSLYIADLLAEAGLPDGVFNVLNGDAGVVDRLLLDPAIAAISFVGSTRVAEHIYRTAADYGKRVQALGGAKNHAVVMPDADLDNVVQSLLGAAYGSCGERCMAISAVVCVGDEVADSLVGRLAEAVRGLRIGDGCAQGNDLGPLISRPHLEYVSSCLDAGIAEGATLVVDGRGLQVPGHEQGYFLGGCLFDHVTSDMRIAREEIFGPVLSVMRCDSLEHAVDIINANEYGNGTCIYTRDGGLARYFADRVSVGMVGINVPLPVPVAWHSFGGWKRSLFGDLGIYGPDAIRFYTRRKTISERWPADTVEQAQFSFPCHG